MLIFVLICFYICSLLQTTKVKPPSPFTYLPTSHTCSNNLVLAVGSLNFPLPQEKDLFEVYDMAFANTHFGKGETLCKLSIKFALT